MKIIETTFERLPRERLVIGFEGENLRATVRIDCASVFAEYPNATPALIVKPLFADAYPVVVDRNGTDVDWLITSEILSFSGVGEIQLVFYKDQVICKSAVSKIRVSRSLTVTGDMPDPVAQWIDDANAKLAEVDAVIVSIDEMDATAHGLPEGSAPTAEVQDIDDHKRIALGIPVGATGATGAKGDKGDRGEVGATPQMGIGQVSTLPAGSSATASMSGTPENPLLNLGIPQGIQGVKGDRGEKGETGATGATGATPDLSIGTVSTLPAGSSATAEITGTPENPVLSFGIPQGEQGVQGVQGEKGDPGDGVPVGGLKGQVLAKASDTDRATEWINVAPVVKNTASGSIASFPDGADGHPVDELKVAIEPVQDLHGYDHPWPAGGGKNLFHVDSRVSSTVAGVTYTSDDDYVYLNGTKYGQGYVTFNRLSISLEPGTYYARAFAVGGTSTNQIYIYANDGNADFGGDILSAERTYTIAETTTVIFRFLISVDGAVFSNYKIGIVISKTSGVDVFYPYSNICPITGWDGVQIVVSPTADAADGQTYSIALPTEAGTVYGGELTVNADGSGSLVVDRKNIVYDGSNNYTWTYVSNCHCMICGNEISDIEYGVSIVDYQNSYGIIVHRTSMNAKQLQFGSSQKPIEAIAPSVEEWKAKLNENPIQLVYLLATPITYTLTASQIRTLLGTNNVWSDAGQLALTYTGTDEHLTLESGKKYLARLSGTDSMLLGSGQEITAAKGTDNVFDLTQMFGTDVADYVYGQGAAFFRKWFPNAVYLHNAGELKHVEGLQSHDMVGFNAWDSSTDNIGKSIAANGDLQNSTNYATSDYISVFPNTTYYLKNVAPSANARTIYCYDASKNPIRDLGLSGAQNAPESGLITTVDNTHYVRIVRFVTTTEYGISLSHNGSRNGEYEPYEKHSYPLDSSVILRGIPKVGANGVYWDGDRYLPDGTIERRYGVVDLGTLNWTKYTNVEPVRFYSVVSDGLVPLTSPSGTGDGACSKYRIIPRGVTSTMSDKSMFVGSSFVSLDRFSVVIRDDELSGLSQQQFKAAMSGVLLVYKLNTPTTETAQPYHSTQWVSDWGTEEFVSTGIVPVGHETRYPANLRDKLQHLPDAASGNGSYLITQTDGQMVLTPFPAPPSTAGNYVLKATVTNGVATYTWEVAT